MQMTDYFREQCHILSKQMLHINLQVLYLNVLYHTYMNPVPFSYGLFQKLRVETSTSLNGKINFVVFSHCFGSRALPF